MKSLLLSAFLALLCFDISAQQVKGKVMDANARPIEGVLILLNGSTDTVFSDSEGTFILDPSNDSVLNIYVFKSFYILDTIAQEDDGFLFIRMRYVQNMGGGVVRAVKKRNIQIGMEIIDQHELKKSACCDLAGCFENQSTVQSMTTNVITNSKELRILGLSGVYNQILLDGFPLIQGLGFTYGISNIPGTLVENIFVSKGTTSVLQGFENMVGQINVVTKPSNKGDKSFFNLYVNSFGESQYNINHRFGGKNWSNLSSVHMVQPAKKWDRDKDNFLDLPQLTRYLLYNKFDFGNENAKGLNGMISARGLWEQREGGQMDFQSDHHLGSDSIYGQRIQYGQMELYAKLSYRFNSVKRISLFNSGFYHNQNSWLGTVNYQAWQKNTYSTIQYEYNWNSNHDFKGGLTYRFFDLNERIKFSDTILKRSYDGVYRKTEFIPGVFAENVFKWRGDLIQLITGIRADHHNEFGWQVSPRTMFKYEFGSDYTLRASIGSGWRTVNLFSENIGLLVSSRNIIFKESLLPEKSLNWGLNLMKKFQIKKLEAVWTFDYYQTRFSQQFFPDYDSDPGLAVISNFTDKSISNGFQTDLNLKYNKFLEAKLAYNFLDVYRVVNQSKFILPFISKHKCMMSLSYLPKNNKFRFDANVHWYGRQRLPDTEKNPEAYRQAKWSRPYSTINIQVTKNWKSIEVYTGVENLFDFRQIRPIVSWQDPFSPYFDTSFNWGPTRGREIYLGLRFKLNEIRDK